MFKPRLTSGASTPTPTTSGHEALSQRPTGVQTRQPATTQGEVLAGLQHTRRSLGGAAAPQNPPPSGTRASHAPMSPGLSMNAMTFVPNAPQHATWAARKAVPSTRELTPDQALAWGQQMHARLRQTPFFPEGHDADFMLSELFQRPLAAGEVVIGAGDENGPPKGLLRASAVLQPGIGIDRASINIQQMLAYPPRQGELAPEKWTPRGLLC